MWSGKKVHDHLWNWVKSSAAGFWSHHRILQGPILKFYSGKRCEILDDIRGAVKVHQATHHYLQLAVAIWPCGTALIPTRTQHLQQGVPVIPAQIQDHQGSGTQTEHDSGCIPGMLLTGCWHVVWNQAFSSCPLHLNQCCTDDASSCSSTQRGPVMLWNQ